MRLRDLADELERRRASSKDIVVDSANMELVPVEGGPVQMAVQMDDKDAELYGITPWAHGQLAEKCQIPKQYYDRMLSTGHGELLAANVNEWLPAKERRMLRVLDGNVRAVVSDKFNTRLDNYGLAFASLEVFNDLKAAGKPIEIVNAELTDRHMYVKAIRRDLGYSIGTIMRGGVQQDDLVYMGASMSNSEVGDGAFSVSPYMWRVACANGMINEQTLRRVHIGERMEVGVFTEQTLELADELLWRKAKDTLYAGFNEELFAEWVDQVKFGKEVVIARPTEVIDNLAGAYKITEDRKAALLDAFTVEAAEGNNNLWGLANAVTRLAHTEATAEGAVNLEKLGARIATLQGRELDELLVAPTVRRKR